jgi:hypothetical protein
LAVTETVDANSLPVVAAQAPDVYVARTCGPDSFVISTMTRRAFSR